MLAAFPKIPIIFVNNFKILIMDYMNEYYQKINFLTLVNVYHKTKYVIGGATLLLGN